MTEKTNNQNKDKMKKKKKKPKVVNNDGEKKVN